MTTTVGDLLDESLRHHSSTELFVRFETGDGAELGDVVRVYRAGIQVVVMLETGIDNDSDLDDTPTTRRTRGDDGRRVRVHLPAPVPITRKRRSRRTQERGGKAEGRAS